MADIFLSYSTDDHAKTKSLAEALMREGWDVFWDRNIPVGKSWDTVLDEELPKAKAITSLWSPSSVKSDWVRTESHYGHKNKKLLPAMIKESEVPIAFSLIQYADLSTWNGNATSHEGFQKLVTALKLTAGDPSGRKPVAPRAPLVQTGNSPKRLFLGYARHDQAIAERLVAALKQEGFSTWWDPEIPIGSSFEDSIVGALEASQFVLVLWSNRGVRSSWVQEEAQWALEQSKLVGLVIEHVSVPLGFRAAPALGFENWDGTTTDPAFRLLLQALGGPAKEDVLKRSVTESRRRRILVATAILLFCLGLVIGLAIAFQIRN